MDEDSLGGSDPQPEQEDTNKTHTKAGGELAAASPGTGEDPGSEIGLVDSGSGLNGTEIAPGHESSQPEQAGTIKTYTNASGELASASPEAGKDPGSESELVDSGSGLDGTKIASGHEIPQPEHEDTIKTHTNAGGELAAASPEASEDPGSKSELVDSGSGLDGTKITSGLEIPQPEHEDTIKTHTNAGGELAAASPEARENSGSGLDGSKIAPGNESPQPEQEDTIKTHTNSGGVVAAASPEAGEDPGSESEGVGSGSGLNGTKIAPGHEIPQPEHEDTIKTHTNAGGELAAASPEASEDPGSKSELVDSGSGLDGTKITSGLEIPQPEHEDTIKTHTNAGGELAAASPEARENSGSGLDGSKIAPGNESPQPEQEDTIKTHTNSGGVVAAASPEAGEDPGSESEGVGSGSGLNGTKIAPGHEIPQPEQEDTIKIHTNAGGELAAANPGTGEDPGSEIGLVDSGSGLNGTEIAGHESPEPSKFYRPPSMRARHQKQNEVGPEITDASIPTVPTFEQFILQQVKEKKIKGALPKERPNPNNCSSFIRSNQSLNRSYDNPQRKRQQYTYGRDMTCNTLAPISRSESVVILEKINRQKESFKKLIESPPDDRNRDVFALVLELVTNVWKSSFEESKKLLLLEICNSKFIDHLQLYLMQLPYTENRRDKLDNNQYWTKEQEFWGNFMTFCECIINVSPSTAVRKCGSLIEVTSKSCLEGLKEKHDFELPADYSTRLNNIRDSLRNQAQLQKKSKINTDEPLESFRELSVLPTGAELLERRPFLRPNVVEGAYSDVEHYLDVQFRLLREDCFGPLRDGINQFIEEPKKRKYDHIRVYRNVQFMGPFFTKQQFGSLVLLDQYTEKMFKNINWKQSKRFLYGSLVLFTKDNCKSFLVGTILQRDEELLTKRLLGVSIIDSAMDSDLYNEDLYTMIECEVYFEPYQHVLKALQDPKFPEHLAMSKYIVGVQKVPGNPAYLTQSTEYILNKKPRLILRRRKKDNDDEIDEIKFLVLQDESWPSETKLGLNSTQYEAYKLALTHEFAVIQGPPGTGKTFLGVKVAKTLLENVKCSMLVICYTNHALDQFLEALLPVTDSIVRIGGRSQSKLLENYNISSHRGWACYEERFELEYRIRKLKDFYEACISPDVLLNCRTVMTYVKECEIVYGVYGDKIDKYDDALKHWLFEDVENIKVMPRFEEHVQTNANDKENKDVDHDIYARDEFDVDDKIDEDSFNRKIYASTLVSFSLPEAKEMMSKLVYQYHKTKEEEEHVNHNFRLMDYSKILLDLQREIFELHSHIKLFKDMMMCQTRAPRVNLANVQDLSTVPRIERWSFYYKWANIVKSHLKKQAKKREELVKSAAEAYEEARMIADRSLLSHTRVIGMTTSAAARLRKLLVEISPPIVIVEEAAEVLEAHIVTSLTKNCQHLILIGDHQQLRPSAAYMKLARHYQLEVSLFERMIRNGVHSRRLGVQHRMRPEIAALVAPHIYPDLRNHPSVEDFPSVRGVAHNLFFISHNYIEQSPDDNSTRTNTLEADFTLRLANYLMQQGYEPDEVTIVAAYSGQMFYMRRQRSLYDHLSDVKITVLDNYQGEESRIILLSLVRNNTNDSIGFLGTENRICVALSRAKEGFFILGNIDLLKRNSTLWTNIAKTLADNGSLGTSLKLKCENHPDQITAITSLEDFAKVPEGGCLLDCKYKLPSCGHPCPRMCHSYDIAHEEIKCTRDCERNICEIEGHNCPFKCSVKCQPCMRLMDKLLPCGHTRAIQCYIPPNHPSVYCAEEVAVKLPGCEHEAIKPCSQRISDVKCVEKCEAGRLSCGHACIQRCHVNDDPDHENYKCEKPCPRAKKHCTADLEGDLGDHQCPMLCGEPCLPCDVQVNKKRTGCKHSKRVACREDVNAQKCREKCARSLPCGHHCKKLCFEKCGDCQQRVKKTIPDCNHEIDIECGTEPAHEHCTEKCERDMACGHPCPGRCKVPCDQTACAVITEHSAEAACGHSVLLPCYVYQTLQTGSVSVRTLLLTCTAPCGTVLRCGHVCGGTCAGCRQGRLHEPCAARCHQLNICGHRCEEPCNQVCPPCRRRCSVRCPHSACGRPCGAPCTPCTETPCARSCPHSACTRPCGAPCSRAPCSAACSRALACGHACRGLCGEPCPPACRLCHPDRFPADLLGDPYDDDAKLIQLQDCPHIFDVDTLDTLMNAENETIQIKTCPFCREPIVNTYRYKDLVNKMLKNDINPIKEKVYGTEQQRSKKRVELYKKVKDLAGTLKLARENSWWNTAYNALRYVVGEKRKDLSVLHFDMYHIYFDILADVGDYYTRYVAQHLSELKTEMQEQVKLICSALVASKQKISQQQQADIGLELKRMNSILQLSKILGFCKNATNPEVQQTAKIATEAVLSWRVYDEEMAVECLKKLEKAVELSGIASKEERAMVVRAIGLKAGHWYKCPNGHFYCIGECGGAMQLARCPDCGANIGGQRHALTAGNQHAREMDGSRFAAWSTEANNMANFQLDD